MYIRSLWMWQSIFRKECHHLFLPSSIFTCHFSQNIFPKNWFSLRKGGHLMCVTSDAHVIQAHFTASLLWDMDFHISWYIVGLSAFGEADILSSACYLLFFPPFLKIPKLNLFYFKEKKRRKSRISFRTGLLGFCLPSLFFWRSSEGLRHFVLTVGHWLQQLTPICTVGLCYFTLDSGLQFPCPGCPEFTCILFDGASNMILYLIKI